jgi:tetratricopeptide (TPR) repeat protein
MHAKLGAFILLAGMLSSATAAAETKEQYDWCYAVTATDEQTIQGCTAMIESGRYSGTQLGGAYNNRSTAYHDKGEWDLAAKDIEQAVKLSPANAEAFYNLGSIYYGEGKYSQAISTFNRAIAVRPDYGNAVNYRGLAFQKMGKTARANQDFDESIQDYDKAAAASPSEALGFFRRCRGRAIWGRQLDRAASDCNQALQLNANYADAFEGRGLVEFRTGDDADAVKDCNSALAIDPYRPSSLYIRGLAKKRSGDAPGGAADIAAAKAINPEVAKEYAGYGIFPAKK